MKHTVIVYLPTNNWNSPTKVTSGETQEKTFSRRQRVQKRTVPGKKGSARPNRAGTGPKMDGSGQERVGEFKNGAGRGRRVRKGTVPGQEGVGASKIEQGEVGASQNGAGSGRRVQKRGRKRSVRPKRDD